MTPEEIIGERAAIERKNANERREVQRGEAEIEKHEAAIIAAKANNRALRNNITERTKRFVKLGKEYKELTGTDIRIYAIKAKATHREK